jgi:protein-disulfide isomerase
MENNKLNMYLVPIAVILAGIFIGGAVVWNGSHPAATGTTDTTGATAAVNIKDVTTTGDPYIGDANAPVTIAFWSDYQCPYCKAFEVGGVSGITTPAAMPDILTNYVNTGKVKIVFKDFQFLGPDSMVDAEYARSVWALYPSQFFAWRSAFYTAEPEENSLDATQNLALIKSVTDSISGMDFSKLQADVAANQATYDAAINADKTEGSSFGITATPSFIIGTQLIAGAYPYATFQTALDAELAK